jgi:hypothetical protein
MSSHKKRDMVPINLCAKFDPPMIALHYRLKNEKDKTYVHDMQVTCGNLNSEEIYTQLCEMEKPYLDGKSIPKSQVNHSYRSSSSWIKLSPNLKQAH